MRLLLDSHLQVRVAAELRRRGLDVQHLSEWREGVLLHATDEVILLAAAQEERTFVTRDRATVERLLIRLWRRELHHAGVLFVDTEAIADIGGLVRALLSLIEATRDWDWTDRVLTLEPR